MPNLSLFFLCALDELDATGAVGIEHDELLFDLVVVKHGDDVRAYVNSCPHKGTPLEMLPNKFLNETREQLVCTTHGARFNVSDGLCIFGPCDGVGLKPVKVCVKNAKVFLPRSP